MTTLHLRIVKGNPSGSTPQERFEAANARCIALHDEYERIFPLRMVRRWRILAAAGRELDAMRLAVEDMEAV